MSADTIAAINGFEAPSGFQEEGSREQSFLYSLGNYIKPIGSSAAPPAAAEVEEEGAGVGAGVPAETLLCALISGNPRWVVRVVSTGSSE